MKPKPFSALNHFTVPCATGAPTFVRADGPAQVVGPGYSLFRPRTRTWNSNRARGYNTECEERATPRTFPTGRVEPGPGSDSRLRPASGTHPMRPAART